MTTVSNEGAMFASWLEALEQRHLADLRFSELTRALRALSADYVQRRERLRHAALDGRGKRAAFALFYGPLHFLVVQRIARELFASTRLDHVTDLGCGTGAAGAALAVTTGATAVTGVDRQGWALEEAAWTYRHFGLRHRAIRQGVAGARDAWGGTAASAGRSDKARPTEVKAVVAGYTVNELTDDERAALLPILLERARRGTAVLIVEPIARGVTPWWNDWASAFRREGGRADEWRFAESLPERLRALDRAAGLDHREQTARSISVTLQ